MKYKKKTYLQEEKKLNFFYKKNIIDLTIDSHIFFENEPTICA